MQKIIYTFITPYLLIINCLLPIISFSQSGSLDLTFGSGGTVTTDFGGSDDAGNSIMIQIDGKIVVAGMGEIASNDDFVLARYNSDGSLDATFGSGGKVFTAIGSGHDRCYSVCQQADGKIVVAGTSYITNPDADFALVRYNSNGGLDSTFDSDGKVTTPVGNTFDFAYSVNIQNDGKIVAAGYSWNGFDYDFAVIRYNSDGSLDNTFDTDGKVTTAIGNADDAGYSSVIQSDGKIVVAGLSFNGINNDFSSVRYNSDGSLDSTFDSDGKVITSFGGNSYCNSVHQQMDGKILLAGTGISDFALARYNNDGSLDNTFDSDGMVTTAIGVSFDVIYSIRQQADGKIVVGGWSHISSSGGDFALARYNGNGNLDNTFDFDGIVTTSIGPDDDEGLSLAIQGDGKIVLSGSTDNGSDDDFAVTRYHADPVGIDDVFASLSIESIYPNPVISELTIQSLEEINQIKITDVLGKEIFNSQIQPTSNSFKLQTSNYPPGVYFLEIFSGDKKGIARFLKVD